MITIKIQAGLGNQMFQYALARAINLRTKKNIVLDLSFYEKGGVASGDIVRYLDLDKFNIYNFEKRYGETPKKFILFEKIKRKIFKESNLVFYKKYLKPKDNSYLIGFWQTEKYFKDYEYEIRKDFTLKDKIEDQKDTLSKKYLEEINNSKISISVNVRRGDYANVKHTNIYHGLLSKKYFKEGLEKALSILANRDENLDLKDINLFIFSDDILWCKNNFEFVNQNINKVFVDENLSAVETLYLISRCKHNIIANSSFSWWGAWLNENKNKIIIRPKRWMADKSFNEENTKDVCPENWIKIENEFDFI